MSQVPQRKNPRIDLVGEVYYEVNCSQRLARWTDISQDGLFIQTMHPLGMGLEFTHLHPEAKRLIEGTAKLPLEQITRDTRQTQPLLTGDKTYA